MKTAIIVWSLTLAATPVWAQTPGVVKRTLPAAASHVTLPAKSPDPDKPKTPEKAAAPAAGKPAAAGPGDSAESAAERIIRRLDEAFPKKATGEKPAAPKVAVAKQSAVTAPPARRAETSAPPRASKHVTLTWRIALRWPDEIAPTHQVK